jgi:hypothetical protein
MALRYAAYGRVTRKRTDAVDVDSKEQSGTAQLGGSVRGLNPRMPGADDNHIIFGHNKILTAKIRR